MPSECYELVVSGTITGQFVQNILHLNIDNTASTDPFAVAKAILTKFNAATQFLEKFLDCLPDAYAATSMRCRRILPTGGPTEIFTQGQLYTSGGTRSGTVMVNTTSPLLIWLTAIRPAKTGRIFFPGATETDLADNQIQAPLLAKLVAFGTYWATGGTLTSPAYNWNGSLYRRSLAAADDITAARVSPVIGNQRRRQHPL